MIINVIQSEGKTVIRIESENFSGKESDELQNTILDLILKGEKSIGIDLSELKSITSSCIGNLIHAHTTCTNKKLEFYLIGVNEKILKIFGKVGLERIFNIKNHA